MIRVVEVISDMNLGGAGKLLLNRVKNMNMEIFDVTVVIPQGSVLLESLKKENVRVYEINGGKNKSFELKSLWRFYKLVKKIKPDIINAHGSMNARLAAKFVGIKVKLFTRHCDFPVNRVFRYRVIRFLYGFFNDFISDSAIAVSESAKNNLMNLGVKKEKIKVIINGSGKVHTLSVEEKNAFREKLNISESSIVVSIFARIEKYKDHITFLKAANILKKDNYVFLIIGAGNEEKEIKKYAKKLNLGNNVIFTGFVSDITPWMNITDINVNCSIGTETSSLALSEGMSLGIPAVVSDYPGNTYMVDSWENGIIFPQGDFNALADKIRVLAESKELYSKLSIGARKRFNEELNAQMMTKKTEEYYLEMYNKKTCNNTDL